MYFLNPLALWVLGLIPLLVLIHNLRPKIRRVVVTNLFLWAGAAKERKAGRRIRRIILKNLPLLVQVLMVILAGLALAKPVWIQEIPKTEDLVLIIDTSASMKTRTGSVTRFDLAKQKALELVHGLPEGRRMLIIEAGKFPVVASPFSEDTDRLAATLDSLSARDVAGNLETAVFLGLSFINPEKNDRVFLVTDGAGCDFEKIISIHKKIKPVLVSGGDNNAGITAFEFRKEPVRNTHYEIMVEVKNFTTQKIRCPIRLMLDKNVIAVENVNLTEKEKKLLIFPYHGPIAGTATAMLEYDDDFSVDNTAYSVLNTSEDIWILYVSKGNFFLEKLMSVYPNFKVNRVDQVLPESWETQTKENDIIIIDRETVPPVTRGNILLIDAFSPAIPISKTGVVDYPEVMNWDRKSPLMANLNPAGIQIRRASRVKTGSRMIPVMETRTSGLIYTYKTDELRAVFIGFDLTQSDLPLNVAFPMMMSNIFHWLHPEKLQFSSAQVKTGDPYRIHLETQTRSFLVKQPLGRFKKYHSRTGFFDFRETNDTGFYKIAEGNRRRYFAANLTSETESDIICPEPNQDPAESETMETQRIFIEKPLWTLFLLLVSFVLIFEWYIWLKTRHDQKK